MNEDEFLKETLASLREAVPPEDVRLRNRSAVQMALRVPSTRHWWQRSIAVPVPAALLAAALLLISFTIHLNGLKTGNGNRNPENSSQGEKNLSTVLAASSDRQADYSETQRYLSGVGVFDRSMLYQNKE